MRYDRGLLGSLVASLLFCLAFSKRDAQNCKQCAGESWAGCNGTEKICVAQQKCVSVASESIENVLEDKDEVKKITKKVARNCASPDFCDADLSMNFKYAVWKIRTTCLSDQVHITVAEEAPANGRKCIGCIAAPSQCTKTVECRGKEDMCISAREQVAGNIMVIKGCATQSACKLGVNISELLGPVLVGSVSCCEGNLCNAAWIGRQRPFALQKGA
ncbi:phospholipase A2 inhibitor subunit gamma B-like [Scleropages formosus]|uniref:phospholipase A2 inhibitor subunit gamma B-like n=1 Tax=Scleropages formosus TaxID=113540 RepID=UPI0010FA78A3|nr:phospholipase A2 inhibitor subunit gamma B-like [Scleropages formosus]